MSPAGIFDADEQRWATHIVQQIHGCDPGIPIPISDLNSYGGGQVCNATIGDGPLLQRPRRDWAASSPANVAGDRDLGPLLPLHIGLRDDYHPNSAGKLLFGGQLVAIFD